MIDKLHEDCLISIFQKLDFIDRVRLEVKQASYANIKEVNMADFLANDSSGYFQQEFISFAPTVIGVVKRCGRYVRTISFGQRWLKISQPIIDAIADYCTRLTELDLGCIILDADISILLEKIGENLETFSLEETSWVNKDNGDKVQDFFQRMKKMKKINLRRASFKLNKLHELPPCLQSIEISGANSLPAEILNAFLALHPNLIELELSPLSVTDDMTLSYISGLPVLQSLHIGYIQKEARLLPMEPLAFCSTIQNLHIQNCTTLTGQSLRLILEGLVNLRSLTIISCSKVFDYSSLSQCRLLDSLSIGHSPHLSDEELIPLAAHKRLRSLTLNKCFNITNISIQAVLRDCTLTNISLVSCEGITDEVLYMLASAQHAIETISVQGCPCITSKGVAALALMKNITKLRELDISHNRNIDDMAILSIHNGLTLKRRENEGNCRDEDKENGMQSQSSSNEIQKERKHEVEFLDSKYIAKNVSKVLKMSF
uniref:F-box domain-containing protein n=1 Tax=Setaria digitata TaxID=48799 RepID=A0A915PR36_9BILA